MSLLTCHGSVLKLTHVHIPLCVIIYEIKLPCFQHWWWRGVGVGVEGLGDGLGEVEEMGTCHYSPVMGLFSNLFICIFLSVS